MKYSHTRRGFTLIELLVVVLIIAILAAVAVPQYQKAVWKARLAGPVTFAHNAEKVLSLYSLENGFSDAEAMSLVGKKAEISALIDIAPGTNCNDYTCQDNWFKYDAEMDPDRYSWTIRLLEDEIDSYFYCDTYADGSQDCFCSYNENILHSKSICDSIQQLLPRNWRIFHI